MKLTIIPIDKTVYVDGLSYNNLDWQDTPPDVHALQWFDSNEGWIEYVTDNFGNKKPNEKITALPLWANNAVEAWNSVNNSQTQQVITPE